MNTSMNPRLSSAVSAQALLDGLLLVFSVVSGCILARAEFFHTFIAGGDVPVIIGIVGLFGTIVYFSAVALVRPSARDRWCQIIVVTTAVITIFGVTERSVLARIDSPHHVWFVSDGTVQIESATRLFLQGQNPYTADFYTTAHGWRFDPYRQGLADPARTHFVYPPGNLILMAPLIMAADALHVPPDGRLLSVAALLVMWLMLISTQKDAGAKTRITLLTLANPLLYLLAVAGFNDVIAVTGLLAAAIFGQRQRWVWSAVWLAIAVVMKQTTWLFVPLWVLWLWSDRGIIRRTRLTAAASFAGLAAAALGPFVLWNAPSFMADVVWYPAGAIPGTFEIAGPTVLQYLSSFTQAHPGPATALSVVATSLGLLLGGLMIRRDVTATWWLIGGVIATLLAAIVHKFFYYNYAIAFVALIAGAYILHRHADVQE